MRISILATAVAAALAWSAAADAEPAHRLPAPTFDETVAANAGPETTVLAGGCFWGVQGVFQHVKGVTSAVSGYTGGDKEHAIYEVVGTGATGHAESVEITYDPHQITFGKLLQIYFAVAHDPTELDYQGPDHGTQYRSTIFARDEGQARIATAYIAQLGKAHVFDAPVVTTIEPGKTFFPAETYHQDFLTLHPDYPYIVYNDLPKVAALKAAFPDVYRDKPVLVMAGK